MSYKSVIQKVSQDLGLPEDYVNKVYRSYWRALKEYIISVPIKETPLEELSKYYMSFNVPSLGKFYFNKDMIAAIKRKQNDKIKES